MRERDFWRRGGSPWPATALLPAAAIYAAAVRLRGWGRAPYRPPVPVVVAGGLTLGGAGKTPLALALAEKLSPRNPHFLSRGYGGRARGPLRVDPARHDAAEVGDEPLLLAAAAATWIARDRAAGAKAAVDDGAGLLILDDGFQNPFVAKDLSVLAIDGESGLGNGHVFPAGPLREPAERALRRAGAVVLIGSDGAGVAACIGGRCPILAARLAATNAAAVAGARVYAFAGIGRPEKFFASLEDAGALVVSRRAFADHHPYTAAEAAALVSAAKAAGAVPITTAKDRQRLPSSFHDRIRTFEVRLEFEDPAAVAALLSRL